MISCVIKAIKYHTWVALKRDQLDYYTSSEFRGEMFWSTSFTLRHCDFGILIGLMKSEEKDAAKRQQNIGYICSVLYRPHTQLISILSRGFNQYPVFKEAHDSRTLMLIDLTSFANLKSMENAYTQSYPSVTFNPYTTLSFVYLSPP